MIFPTEAILEAREALRRSPTPEQTPDAALLEKHLAIDPDFGPALLGLATRRAKDGDADDAERLLRRGMTAHPCDYKFLMMLAGVLNRKAAGNALAPALLELAAAKLLSRPDEIDRVAGLGIAPPRFADPDSLRELAAELHALRDSEPPEVTAELKAYRLIHELEEALGNQLERELVDAILAERDACRPLLIGVLRGLAEGELPDGGEMMGEAALALLGEIGDPDSLPALVQFAGVDDRGVSDAADWALKRIAGQHPAEALAVFRNFDRRMTGAERACMAEIIAVMPATPGKSDALAALFENFGVVDTSERTDIFVMVSAAMLHAAGKAAPALIRDAQQHLGALLPKDARKAVDDLLRAWTSDPSLFEIEPDPPSTVYDICCADRLDGYSDEEDEEEEGDEEDDEGGEEEENGHVHGPGCSHHHAAPPGRNEPCWCGSGKKYKKCHLEADEAARHEPRGEQ
jgi:SEC-C motif-containing protein